MIFAVSAHITARAECDLAEKAAESVRAFYNAEYRATVRLADVYESGSFTEEIDENRELFIRYDFVNNEIVILEWAVVKKGMGDIAGDDTDNNTQGAPMFGTPPIF
jgi:hypothetical protein